MKVYRCLAKLKPIDAEEEGYPKTQAVWYTRKGDNIKSEKVIKNDPKNEAHKVQKFTHKEFDIPTNKVGLVEFLNKFCKR